MGWVLGARLIARADHSWHVRRRLLMERRFLLKFLAGFLAASSLSGCTHYCHRPPPAAVPAVTAFPPPAGPIHAAPMHPGQPLPPRPPITEPGVPGIRMDPPQ